jgi:hypothetical protein
MFEFIIFGLLLKHFLIDFPLQTPYMYLNKGTYGHWGGILHAYLHGIGTFIVLILCGGPVYASVLLGLFDYVLHYHIDWAKVKLTKHYELTPTNSEKYWWLLGFDQLLHQLTYVGIGLLA